MQRFVVKMANPTINDATMPNSTDHTRIGSCAIRLTLVDLILRRLENTNHVGCGPKAAEVFLIPALVDAAEKGIMRRHHKAMERTARVDL